MREIWGDVGRCGPLAACDAPFPPLTLANSRKGGAVCPPPSPSSDGRFSLLGREQAPRRRGRRGREVTRRRDEEGRLGRGRRQEAGGRGRQGGRGQGQGASQGGGLAAGQGRQVALTCALGRRDGPRLCRARAVARLHVHEVHVWGEAGLCALQASRRRPAPPSIFSISPDLTYTRRAVFAVKVVKR